MSNAAHVAPQGINCRRVLAPMALAILLLGACSGDSVSQAERAPAPTSIPAPSGIGDDGSELTLEVIAGGDATGRVITDHRGFAVYGVNGEAASGQPECAGDCLDVWIPVTPRQGTVAADLDAALYDTFVRPDGIEQVAYADVPLYLWSGDRQVGITGGAGVAGIWFALTETAGFIGP